MGGVVMPFGLLFRRTSNTHPDPEKDRRRWKAGDIVCIYEVRQCADNPAPNSPHDILVVTDGPPASEVRPIVGPREAGQGVAYTKSRWRIDLSRLPVPAAAAIAAHLRAECTYAQFEAAVIEKNLGLPMRDMGLKEIGIG